MDFALVAETPLPNSLHARLIRRHSLYACASSATSSSGGSALRWSPIHKFDRKPASRFSCLGLHSLSLAVSTIPSPLSFAFKLNVLLKHFPCVVVENSRIFDVCLVTNPRRTTDKLPGIWLFSSSSQSSVLRVTRSRDT